MMSWASYFDEISKLAATDRQQKAKDVTEREAKRVGKRAVKKVMTPSYDSLLRVLAKGIRRSPIKVGAISPDLKRVEEKAEEAAKTVGQLAGHSEAHMLARRGIKKTLEPGYVHFLEMLARQAKKIPIPKVAAAALAHQYRFQRQMNRFLKDLMRTKRGPANIFGERAKRPLHQIYFPRTKMSQGTITVMRDPKQIAGVQQQMRQMGSGLKATYKPQAGLKYWRGLRAGGSEEIGSMPPKPVMPKVTRMPSSVGAGDVLTRMRKGVL